MVFKCKKKKKKNPTLQLQSVLHNRLAFSLWEFMNSIVHVFITSELNRQIYQTIVVTLNSIVKVLVEGKRKCFHSSPMADSLNAVVTSSVRV